MAPLTRASPAPLNDMSIRTLPVKYCSGPWVDGCEPLRMSWMVDVPLDRWMGCGQRRADRQSPRRAGTSSKALLSKISISSGSVTARVETWSCRQGDGGARASSLRPLIVRKDRWRWCLES